VTPSPDDRTALFRLWCQRQGCTQQVFRVEAASPLPRPGDCGALRAAPSELWRAPRRPFKTTRSRSAKRSQLVLGSTRGQSRGRWSSGPLPICSRAPKACRGPIQTTRSGTLTQRGTKGSGSQRLWPRPVRSSLAASVRRSSSPTRSATLRHGSGIVVSWSGTGQPSRRYSSRTAW
jgi:hypothetical protein